MLQMCKVIFWLLFLTIHYSYPQSVSGKLIDQNKKNIAAANLKLYVSSKEYSATSGSNGEFVFSNITGVEKEHLPAGYSITENYPNPFNPKTRIGFSLPNSGSVRVEVFNSLGQKVKTVEEKDYSAGSSYIDLEMSGLSNGVYIAKITLDNKYSIIRKMMLLYGSQHLNTSGGYTGMQISKPSNDSRITAETKIDSLVVEGNSIYKKVFKNLPVIQATGLNLGELIVITPCPGIRTFSYEGQTYNTVKIGTLCWMKENLNAGTMILGTQDQSNNSILEKYCYDNNEDNCKKYGGLYQWAEAVQYKNGAGNTVSPNPAYTTYVRGVCPEDWHVPSSQELDSLKKFANNVKAALLDENQPSGTNTTGFSSLFAGIRLINNGGFNAIDSYANYWSIKESASDRSFNLSMNTSNSSVTIQTINKNYGYSIRCVKNEETIPHIPVLLQPVNGSTGLAYTISLTWQAIMNAAGYSLQVSADSMFNALLFYDSTIVNPVKEISGLSENTKYYWRVKASNKYGSSMWSAVWQFTTRDIPRPCPGIPTFNYEGKIYNTIKIGNQCWLKENLDVGKMIDGAYLPASPGVIEKYCYNNDTANCTKYGGLYTWSEAMQNSLAEKAQGICPGGWHIPSNADLDSLIRAVNGNGNSITAIGEGNGTNTSGFSGLLAGYRRPHPNFHFENIHEIGSFWGSSSAPFDQAFEYAINKTGSYFGYYAQINPYGYSIRCVLDKLDSVAVPSIPKLKYPVDKSLNLEIPLSLQWFICTWANSYTIQIATDSNFASIVISQNNILENSIKVSTLANSTTYYWRVKAENKYGSSEFSKPWSFQTTSGADISCPGTPTVTDTRDGRIKIYNTVKIGTQCWIKENLDVGSMIKLWTASENNSIIEKYCYDDDTANCTKYGGLYRWKEAMQYEYNEKVKGICPEGWHIPSKAEFETLVSTVNGSRDALLSQGELSGNNLSGFSALLGGSINRNLPELFLGIGFETYFFSSTGTADNTAYRISLTDFYSQVQNYTGSTYNWGFSIRCIKND